MELRRESTETKKTSGFLGHQEPEPTSRVLEEIDSEREAESMRKVEAALFVAGRFLSVQELVALTDVNPLMLRKLLEDIADKYKNSGIEIVRNNELWKMDVATDYRWLVNRLATGSTEFSKAEQETLAMIAYKQPMKQSVLVKIRGNKAYEHVKKFVEMGLIAKKKLGHTAELRLSENFYDYFSLAQGERAVGREGEAGEGKSGNEGGGEGEEGSKEGRWEESGGGAEAGRAEESEEKKGMQEEVEHSGNL